MSKANKLASLAVDVNNLSELADQVTDIENAIVRANTNAQLIDGIADDIEALEANTAVIMNDFADISNVFNSGITYSTDGVNEYYDANSVTNTVATVDIIEMNIQDPQDGELLSYSSEVNTWVNSNAISGDMIHGGIISGFQSTGITDNANSKALTISSDDGGYHNFSLTNMRKMEMIGPEASLHIQGTSTGYVEGSVCFLNSQTISTTKRGAGIFSYTEDNGTNIEWFLGRPYSSNDNIVFARRVITDPSTIYGETAQLTHALVKIDSGGFVTAGNTQREGYFRPSTSGKTKISQWCKLATLRHRFPYMLTFYTTGGSYSPGTKTVIFQKSYSNHMYATTQATLGSGSMFTQIRSNSTSAGNGTYDLEVYATNLWNSGGGERQGFYFVIQPLHNAFNINNDVIIIGSGDNPSSLGNLATVSI